MTSHSSWPYAGAVDLRRMQAGVARAYRATSLRVGDLAWLTRSRTHRELSLDIRLWEDGGGQIIGWTFYRSNAGFNVFVAPGCADDALLDEMLTVISEIARASVAAGDPSSSLYTYGIDVSRSTEDQALAAALERHGFKAAPTTGGVLTRPLNDLPAPSLPAGYRFGWVQSRQHTIGRVEAHRAAFAPSDLTLEKYERVQRAWPYRAEFDRVVLTDDDVVVAFCTGWIDAENAAGLLEPVGTHPVHQRRGLAKAVCLDALRALREAGALTAQVGFASEAGAATYRSIGFEDSARETDYRRDPT